ncbi:hypothetical protein LCGC14_2615390, partial [marine sediment metagenome]
FNARKLSDGLLKESSATIVVQYVKQSSPVEYWNGSAWVTSDPGSQAMAEDSVVLGVYEDSVTYDEAGVDYIVTAWDSADTDVAKVSGRVRGVQAEELDAVWRVQVTLKDTNTSGDAIPSATVSLRNADTDTMDTTTTDANGLADLGAPGAATYTVVIVKFGWTFNTETIVISSSDASPKTAEFYGTQVSVGTPSASYCRIYGWLREVEEGTAIQNQRLVPRVLAQPFADSDGVYYDDENSQVTPDSNGYWYLDLIYGATVRIFSTRVTDGTSTGAVDRTVLVPAQATAQLSTLAEAVIA